MGELSHIKTVHSQSPSVGIQTIFGKGLVHTHAIECSQEWVGCVVSDDCIDTYIAAAEPHVGKVQDLATLDYLVKAGFLIQYPAPLKGGPTGNKWVINWPRFNSDRPSESTVKLAFTMHNKSFNHPSVRAKLGNTLDFFKSDRWLLTIHSSRNRSTRTRFTHQSEIKSTNRELNTITHAPIEYEERWKNA